MTSERYPEYRSGARATAANRAAAANRATAPASAPSRRPAANARPAAGRATASGRATAAPNRGASPRYAASNGGRPANGRTSALARPGTRASGSARRPASGNAARRPSAAKNPASRRRAPQKRRASGWRRLPAKLRLGICAVVLALAVFGIVRLVSRVGGHEDRFVENVFVNGVCLTGYTQAEGYALIEEQAAQRLNSTYTLTFGDGAWSFSPADFGASMDCTSELERAWNLGHVGDRATRQQIVDNLKEVPAEFNSELKYDEAALDGYIADLASQIDTAAVDAEVTLGETKPVITQASQNGLRLDQRQTKENLVALLETGAGDTRLPVDEVEPTITSDDMEMKVVAKFSTDVSFRNRASRENVGLALSYFNGFQVNPGDTVDFNEVVGPRTEARGFQKAPEYAGNETTTGVGGGVCQASTTLYNAVVMTDMTVIMRRSHSMTVQYVEPSQDAAVEYKTDGKNFIFRNDTGHALYIYTDVDKETATVTIYGTRPEYHYQLESKIIYEEKSDRKRYEYDYEGKYCYLTTDTKLKTEGHGSCESEGWLVAYDWDTKEEVSRELVNHDMYRPGVNVYWRGVHDAAGNIVVN